jgi:predicted TIM-barrel fold metal-dependent hydrolase
MALAVAEARHGKPALAEVDYALGELGLAGLMFHHDFGGVAMHEPIMHDILTEVMHHGKHMIVEVHTAQHSMLEPPFSLWILAEKFPDIEFICGHPMMSQIQLDNMVAIAKHCPNVWFDTCCMWNHNNLIETAIEKLGSSEKILFGSDNPYFIEDLCIDKLLIDESDLTEDDRDNIFFRNFERLFEIAGGRNA